MAIIKAVNSGAGLNTAIRYIERKGKLPYNLLDGVNCNPTTAFDEFMLVKERYGKMEGTQYVHLVLALSPDESRRIAEHELMNIAHELVAKAPFFTDYQATIAIHHEKTEHLHAHIIINSVNMENGKKIQFSKYQLRDFKKMLIEMAPSRGLVIPQKGQGLSPGGQGNIRRVLDHTEQDETTKEFYYKKSNGKAKSWETEIAYITKNASSIATSKDNYLELLKAKGITVSRYKDTGDADKDYITYCIDVDGQTKKVRNNRLTEVFKLDFSVEELNNGFKRNTERLQRERECSIATAEQRAGEANSQAQGNNIEAGQPDRAINASVERLVAGAAELRQRAEGVRSRHKSIRSRAEYLAIQLETKRLQERINKMHINKEQNVRVRVKERYRGRNR